MIVATATAVISAQLPGTSCLLVCILLVSMATGYPRCPRSSRRPALSAGTVET